MDEATEAVDNIKQTEIIRLGSAGFCWGVKRAVEMAEELSEGGKRKVYTDGPLIHNNQMMQKLEALRVEEVGDYQSKTDLAVNAQVAEENAIMLVRAHGISPERRQYLKSLGMTFKDATCPDVGIIAGKLKLYAKKGFSAVIFGSPEHPEAIGLMGYTEGRGYVVQSKEEIDALPSNIGPNICMVSQTTMFVEDYDELAVHLKKRFPEVVVLDTICHATKERQTDLKELLDRGVDAVVVIGGRHSANTKKLVILVERNACPAFHVETAEDIDLEALRPYSKIGVTAGASTPEFIIDAVCAKLNQLCS